MIINHEPTAFPFGVILQGIKLFFPLKDILEILRRKIRSLSKGWELEMQSVSVRARARDI